MRKFLYEADDDNATTGGENNNAAENNDAATNDNSQDNNDNADDNQNQDDQNQDDNQKDDNQNDENQDDNNDEENTDDENNDDDFGIDDDDNGGDDENNDDSDSSMDSGEEESNLDPNSLKAKDRELFDSLSIPEQQIKVRELKNQFGELYGNCIAIIDRLNDVSLELNDEYPQLKRLTEVLYNLKETISFYILNIYDIKSYFENDIIFNRYLTVLNGVKTVLKTVKNGLKDDK